MSGTSRTYAYNADGLLQGRTQGGSTTNLLWDPATSPSRLLQVGSDKIVYGLGPLYVVTGSGTTTFARDGGKSVRAELNGSGAVTASFRYKAYGAIAQSNGASAPTYLGYAGQLLDPSGVYYMRARWYDPNTGRLVSRDPEDGDPSEPNTLNAFAYAAGNPLMLIDPTGFGFGDPCSSFVESCEEPADITVLLPGKCDLFPYLTTCQSKRTVLVAENDDTDTAGAVAQRLPVVTPGGQISFSGTSNAKAKRIKQRFQEVEVNGSFTSWADRHLEGLTKRKLSSRYFDQSLTLGDVIDWAVETGDQTAQKVILKVAGGFRKRGG